MAQVSFREQVTVWTRRSKERMLAVRNESVQRVIEKMQEPGPSKASVGKAVAAGAGLGKVGKAGRRGVSKKAFGPVPNPGGSGNLPVDTGFLRASLVVGKAPVQRALRARPDGPGSFTWDAGKVSIALSKAPLTATVEAIYTANYARVAEYGSAGRAPRRFVALAVQQWPRIVAEVCAEARARTGGGFDSLQPRGADGRFTSDEG